jgi:hypothetical protein
MRVWSKDFVDGDALEPLWLLYGEALGELRTRAVQRHLMTRDEFAGVMRDRRVVKCVAEDDAGAPAGLATLTDDLDAVPLISPDYFAHRWPEWYARRRIWYALFVAVDQSVQAAQIFPEFIAALGRLPGDEGGIVAMDFCRERDAVDRMPAAIGWLIGREVAGVRGERLDEQSYWAYEFPTRS